MYCKANKLELLVMCFVHCMNCAFPPSYFPSKSLQPETTAQKSTNPGQTDNFSSAEVLQNSSRFPLLGKLKALTDVHSTPVYFYLYYWISQLLQHWRKQRSKVICNVSQVKCFMLSQCISAAVCLWSPLWPFSAPHSPLMKQAVQGGHKRYHCNREPLIELAGGPASP